MGFNKVRHPLLLTVNKSQEKQPKQTGGKNIETSESHMWGIAEVQ